MTTEEDITASMTFEERAERLRKKREARGTSAFAWSAQQREEREARRISGMGFFRLVWIVALGVLIAQAIGGLVLWIVASVNSTP